ncbi:hypothetical protein HDU92_005091, partial [Lobulomyces angularis]
GDVKTDSALLKNFTVSEMVNGCLCCVLVGQMKNALYEIKEKYNPDRVIIETSGSAFPAPISLQIRELEKDFKLDSIVTVIDCENFIGYEDKSYTAKMQAKYTDLILLNKHEFVSEEKLELVIDHINVLNEDTAKIKYDLKFGVTAEMIFGLDTKLFMNSVETFEVDGENFDKRHHFKEIDLIQIKVKLLANELEKKNSNDYTIKLKGDFENFLNGLSSENIYRVKGFIKLKEDQNHQEKVFILNWAFGKFTLNEIVDVANIDEFDIKLVVMGVDFVNYLENYVTKFKEYFNLFDENHIRFLKGE